jgi:hypothetical protein
MDKPKQNFLLACGVILLVACICLSISSLGGAAWLFFYPSSSSSSDSSPLTEPAATKENPSQDGGSSATRLTEEISQQMDLIEEQVMKLRGLPRTSPVNRVLETPEQLRDRVVNDFFADYTAEEAQDDGRVLSILGLLPPGFDLTGFYLDLYSEQIAGQYDPEKNVMYITQGEGFKGPERLTYSHEFVHALQDQNYDLENGLNYSDEACEADTERCAGIQALVEGDASLAELQWLTEYGTQQDYREIQEYYSRYESPVFDSAPAFMQEDFIFPYTKGQAFVEAIFNAGGWGAVDAVYRNVPVSTEQILHPERYPDDKPTQVELPDLTGILGADYREIDRNVMGEWYTFLILAHGREARYQVDEGQARTAAEGWGGDTYLVYHNAADQSIVLVLRSIWETTVDANQFRSAFEDYGKGRFGKPAVDDTGRLTWQSSDGFVDFRAEDTTTTWIIAPDEVTAGAIWEALP